jgi:hypothetical protein
VFSSFSRSINKSKLKDKSGGKKTAGRRFRYQTRTLDFFPISYRP